LDEKFSLTGLLACAKLRCFRIATFDEVHPLIETLDQRCTFKT